MNLLDRYILKQFLVNFLILFSILFLFSCIIDLFVNLNSFLDAVDESAADAGETLNRFEHFGRLTTYVVSFYFPRLFQFYAFLVGLVTVGAMGFTLVQLHRHRELTAVLAAGVSLHRVAMPILVAAIGLNVVQFVNRELVLPHYAQELMGSQGQFVGRGIEGFRVPLLSDASGRLFYARRYQPNDQVLEDLVILEFDEGRRMTARILAKRASWLAYARVEGDGGSADLNFDAGNEERSAGGVVKPIGEWIFEEGTKTMISRSDEVAGAGGRPMAIERLATDLDPTRVLLSRHREFRQMLSLSEIKELQASYSMDRSELGELARIRFGRFAQILINLLTLLLAMPFFLLRSPTDLLRQSVFCAGFGIVAQVGGAIGVAVGFAGIAPAASVFLVPLLILLPLAMAMMSRVET